jgi:hypothetical protein
MMEGPDAFANGVSLASSVTQEPETEAPAPDARSNRPSEAHEDSNQDAASIMTTTSGLVSDNEGSSLPGFDSEQRKLGLHVNNRQRLSSSLYNDYEYEKQQMKRFR